MKIKPGPRGNSRPEVNLVWIKRDLRTQDHASFQRAESAGLPYIPIYIFDQRLLNHPDVSDRHLAFIRASIKDMNVVLSPLGKSIREFYGDSLTVFKWLNESFLIKNVGLIKKVVSLYRGIGTKRLENFLLKITLNGPNFNKMVFNEAGRIVKIGSKIGT